MVATRFIVFSILSSALSASALPSPGELPRRSALPTHWYHKRDHPVHSLFKRDTPLPTVGSPEWTAQYPQDGALPETDIPQPWIDALNVAVAANLIPDIAPSINQNGNDAIYPADANPGVEPICSAYYQCRHPGDIWDAPNGTIGLSVDDGPVDTPGASGTLYDFLQAHNVHVTHFMIGVNILNNPDMFVRAFQQLNDDIGMHTWTHRYMSELTNEQLVADFGWCMQIIHDSTGGRVPRYWRPPYGDADNRVRAIAKEIFGLTAVVWNNDSEDWTMASNGTTLPAIQAQMTNWYNGPRSPGLIILEHEITPDDVTAWINMYPLIAAATGGTPWVVSSVAGLFDGHNTGWNGNSWYSNSDNDTAPVVSANVLASNSTSSTTNAQTGSHTGTATATATTRSGAEKNLGSIRGIGVGVAVLAGVLCLAL